MNYNNYASIRARTDLFCVIVDRPCVTKLDITLSVMNTGTRTRFFHTFSMPKNLSVPSGRIGPAFTNILSSGVGSGTPSGFFVGEKVAPPFAVP